MKMIRGDTKALKFQRKDKNTQEVITTIPEKMYFTVKENYYVTDFLFQKTLENGIIYNEEDNYYYFTIIPEDTENLSYYTYVYDIEIIDKGQTKTIAKGTISIEEEVTFKENEN